MKRTHIKRILISKDRANKTDLRIDILKKNPSFEQDIIKARKVLHIPKNGLEQFEDASYQWRTTASAKAVKLLEDTVKKIGQKYKLNGLWLEALEDYILTNLFSSTLLGGIVLEQSFSDRYNIPLTKLYLTEDTTKGQIVDAWKYIKVIQKQSPYKVKGKLQPLKEAEKKEMIFKLKEEKKNTKEIKAALKEKYGDDVKNISYLEINEYSKQYKKYYGY